MIRVVAGILRRDGRVLACKRRDDGPHPGRWEFPGGKIEPEEDERSALRRELSEELAIEAEVGTELGTTRHEYPGGPSVELAFFEVTHWRGPIENRAFAEIRWVEPRELGSLDFLEADRETIAALSASRR